MKILRLTNTQVKDSAEAQFPAQRREMGRGVVFHPNLF